MVADWTLATELELATLLALVQTTPSAGVTLQIANMYEGRGPNSLSLIFIAYL